MCHLRGLVMLKLNRSDQAKQCFLEALALDVKCYDSFEQLINGEMMSADEGNQLLLTSVPSLMPVQSGTSSRASRITIRHRKTRILSASYTHHGYASTSTRKSKP